VVDTLDLIARTVKRKQDCFGSIELSGKLGDHALNDGGTLSHWVWARPEAPYGL